MKKSLGAKALVYPTPVFVVGTYDKDGNPNVMTCSWAGLCCSEPPCISISLRKATLTYGNIIRRPVFTISVPSQDFVKHTDYFGMVTGGGPYKFEVAKLTPAESKLVEAPYVKEFPMVLECRVVHQFELGLHTQFVGEILDVKADEAVLDQAGFADIKKVRPFVFTPDTLGYYGIGEYLGPAFSMGAALRQPPPVI